MPLFLFVGINLDKFPLTSRKNYEIIRKIELNYKGGVEY